MVGMSEKVRKANEKTSGSTSAALRHTLHVSQASFISSHGNKSKEACDGLQGH